MQMTINELAAKLNVDRDDAVALVKFLVAKKMIEKTGERPSASGKGKASNVYEIPSQIVIDV